MPVLIKSKNPFFAEREMPEWVDVFFRGLAVLEGLLAIPWLLFITFWGYTNTGGEGSTLVVGAAISLLLLGVFWRQFHLKRWACVLSTIVAWGIAGIFIHLIADELRYSSYGSMVIFPENLLRATISLLFALSMTAACRAGWRGLEPGF